MEEGENMLCGFFCCECGGNLSLYIMKCGDRCYKYFCCNYDFMDFCMSKCFDYDGVEFLLL